MEEMAEYSDTLSYSSPFEKVLLRTFPPLTTDYRTREVAVDEKVVKSSRFSFDAAEVGSGTNPLLEEKKMNMSFFDNKSSSQLHLLLAYLVVTYNISSPAAGNHHSISFTQTQRVPKYPRVGHKNSSSHFALLEGGKKD